MYTYMFICIHTYTYLYINLIPKPPPPISSHGSRSHLLPPVATGQPLPQTLDLEEFLSERVVRSRQLAHPDPAKWPLAGKL